MANSPIDAIGNGKSASVYECGGTWPYNRQVSQLPVIQTSEFRTFVDECLGYFA
jgi:hypothetical protein